MLFKFSRQPWRVVQQILWSKIKTKTNKCHMFVKGIVEKPEFFLLFLSEATADDRRNLLVFLKTADF